MNEEQREEIKEHLITLMERVDNNLPFIAKTASILKECKKLLESEIPTGFEEDTLLLFNDTRELFEKAVDSLNFPEELKETLKCKVYNDFLGSRY